MKRITLYVGSGLDRHGLRIPWQEAERMERNVRIYAAENFGGLTTYVHLGSWVNDGQHVHEGGRTFIAFAHDAVADVQVTAFAEYARDQFRQTSVVLAVEQVDVKLI